MKKKIFHILAVCTLAALGSCGDFDINGDLDGMWHLRTVEDLTKNEITSVKEQCVYYSVQQNLITVKRLYRSDSPVIYDTHIGRFIHTKDSLILHNFRIFQNEGIEATPQSLAPFYLDGTTSRYSIKKLDSDEMVLRSDLRELFFKKF